MKGLKNNPKFLMHSKYSINILFQRLQEKMRFKKSDLFKVAEKVKARI